MLKKLLALLLILPSLTIGLQFSYADSIPVIDEFTGLTRSPVAEKAPNGSHTIFQNLWINDGNIQSVKGRDRLNAAAHSDTVVNGFTYYENGSGTTTKLIVRESDDLVSYDVDGTNRTVLASSLTNESVDFAQIGDTLYMQSQTDGLYKWTGSGSATAVGSVSAPSSVDFTASSTVGGLTTGDDCIFATSVSNKTGTCASFVTSTGCATSLGTGAKCNSGDAGSCVDPGEYCAFVTAATTTTYQYKVTKYSTLLGIESEPSTADSVTLTGSNNFTFGSSGDNFSVTGAQTSTTGTLDSAPSAPFNTYRIYRTVAGGSDFFLVGEQASGTYTDGKADVSLGQPLDTTIDTTTAPSYRYIEEYKGTLFTSENQSIKFTRTPVITPSISDTDTYWISSDEISVGSRKPISGLKSTSDSLLVFTNNDTYEVTGFGATTFRLSQLLRGIGTVSDATIEENESADIIFFSGTQGVYKFRVRSQDIVEGSGNTAIQPSKVDLVKISSPAMDSVFEGSDSLIDLDPSEYAASHAYYDLANSSYFLYIGQHCFIFNELNNSWSYVPATKMSASTYRKSTDAGQGVLIDAVGFFFNNWKGYENGIESGTVTGTPTAVTTTTLTDSTATFNTTSDGLKGLWVYIANENGEYRQITANTATAITVSPAWTINPVVGSDKYYITYIVSELRTKFYNLPESKIPNKAIIKKFWLVNNLADANQDIFFYSLENKNQDVTNLYTISLDEKKVTPVSSPLRNEWVQFGLKGYVYVTSNTGNPPIDIIAYAFKGDTEPLQ